MAAAFLTVDSALKRLQFYRLDPGAHLPASHELDRVQMQAACTLPPAYRYFLSTYGVGGFGTGARAALPHDCPIGNAFSLDMLFGMGSRAEWSPFGLLGSTYRGVLPSALLPIATDPGGNLLLLRCGADEILAWDHEHRELSPAQIDQAIKELAAGGLPTDQYDLGQLILMWERLHPEAVRNPTGHGNLWPVASSFESLLSGLQAHPDY